MQAGLFLAGQYDGEVLITAAITAAIVASVWPGLLIGTVRSV
jgi:hypothetical protein